MEAEPIEALQVNAPPLAARQYLGRYEILERLAVGGMAEIYRARTRGPRAFEKTVALKRILPQHALDPELLHMFLDEARLMASLNHPNIAHVYDVGDDDACPFFTMELVRGVDVRTLLRAHGRRRPLPLEHALAVGMAVASGLHHAHERTNAKGEPLGIVHRDISPSNVLVSFEGAVKIADFGVAKWSEQGSRTEAGQLKGKLAHMSPEQCKGLPLDRRTDVFALGTLLFEMLTGRPAFEAESDFELLTRIVSEDAPPLALPNGERYPRELEEIVRQSLRREREQRTPTAQAVQLALEDFARRHQLVVSSVALADTLGHLFADRLKAAEEAERRWLGIEQGPSARKADAEDEGSADPTKTATRSVGESESDAAKAAGVDEDSPDHTATRVSRVVPPRAAPSKLSAHRLWPVGLAVVLGAGGLVWALSRPHATPPTVQAPPMTAQGLSPASTRNDLPAAATASGPAVLVGSPPPAESHESPPVDVRETEGMPDRPSRGARTGRSPFRRTSAVGPSPAAPPASVVSPTPTLTPQPPKAWDPDSPVPP